MPTRRALLRAGTLACGAAVTMTAHRLALAGPGDAQRPATPPAPGGGHPQHNPSAPDGGGAGEGEPRGAAGDDAQCLDYGNSFICGTAAFNAVRFWVESRTILTDAAAGTTRVFYQCASCKSENTFAQRDLFPADNYDFLPILGEGHWLIFRRHAYLNDDYRQIRTVDQSWGPPVFRLRRARQLTRLETWEQIRDATAAGAPLVARTTLANAEQGLEATLEYPVKTMNVSLEHRLYQVDTGPLGLPDLGSRHEQPLETLRLAFVAFNAADFADFVIEQPTPIMAGEAELCRVYHYASPVSLPARNELFALGRW